MRSITPKRLATGLYTYRGYTLEHVENLWQITAPRDEHPEEAADTRQQAVDFIDSLLLGNNMKSISLKKRQSSIPVSELLELCNSITCDPTLSNAERVITGRIIDTVLEHTGNAVDHGVKFYREKCENGETREYFMAASHKEIKS